jgi:stage V sporulation protein B
MEKIPTSKKIISNLFYYSLDFSIITIFGYIFWILMGKFLVPAQYGILQTVSSIFSILVAITTLGFSEALIKFIPELMKKGKQEEADSMMIFSVKVVTVVSSILSILIFFSAETVSSLIYNSSQLVLPLKLLSLMLFTGTVFTVVKYILQGLQQYKKLFVYDFVANIARIVVAFLFLYVGFQAASGVLGWSFWYIVFIILSLGILKSRKSGRFDKKSFYHFSLLSVLSMILLPVLLQGNMVILGFLSNFESVGFFGVAFIFSQFIMFVPLVIAGAIFPNISELWIENKEHIKHLVSASLKFSTVVVLPILILFSIFSEDLIRIFYTSAYIPASKIFPLVLTGGLLTGLSSILSITLYSIYRPKIRLEIIGLAAIINVLLSLILIPYYGLNGAALAFLVSETIFLFLLLYFTNKNLNFGFSKRSLNIIPITLVFWLILSFSMTLSDAIFKIILVLLDLAVYVILITKLRVLNRNDLFILEFFPNKFGLGFIKRLARKLIR